MKAGRELDALVATKVMGWVTVKSHHLSWVNGLGGLVTWESTSFGSFQPSSDIAAAWTVVEKVRETWLSFDMWYRQRGKYSPERLPVGHGVSFQNDAEPYFAFASADTAPLAICLAALKAVGVEV